MSNNFFSKIKEEKKGILAQQSKYNLRIEWRRNGKFIKFHL